MPLAVGPQRRSAAWRLPKPPPAASEDVDGCRRAGWRRGWRRWPAAAGRGPGGGVRDGWEWSYCACGLHGNSRASAIPHLRIEMWGTRLVGRKLRRSWRMSNRRSFDCGRIATFAQDDSFGGHWERLATRWVRCRRSRRGAASIGAVERLRQRRELAFAGDGVPCGLVQGHVAGGGLEDHGRLPLSPSGRMVKRMPTMPFFSSGGSTSSGISGSQLRWMS